jgi:hypothetical protein
VRIGLNVKPEFSGEEPTRKSARIQAIQNQQADEARALEERAVKQEPEDWTLWSGRFGVRFGALEKRTDPKPYTLNLKF